MYIYQVERFFLKWHDEKQKVGDKSFLHRCAAA